MNIKRQIFISYARRSSEAKDFIDIFKSQVEIYNSKIKNKRLHLKAWTDHEIRAGEFWEQTIDNAIQESFTMLVAVTPEALESPYVTYEWSYAMGLNRLVIPVILDSYKNTESKPDAVKLHDKLSPIQYQNLAHKDTRIPAIRDLINNLENRYQEILRNEKINEGQQLAQLVYSAIEYGRQQRDTGNIKNALQSLEGARNSVEEFEKKYASLSKESTALDDVTDDVYYELGRTYYLLERHKDAEVAFVKALKLNPEHVYSHIDLGILERERADEHTDQHIVDEHLDNAFAHFKKALDLHPGVLDHNGQSVWASLGGICKRRHELKQAIGFYETATQFKKTAYPYSNLGLSYFELGRIPEMVSNFRVALFFAQSQLRLKPDDMWAHCDELVAQIILNQRGDEDEQKDAEKMHRAIEHVLRVSPEVALKRLQSVLIEIVEHNEKHTTANGNHKNIIDVPTAEYTLEQVTAIIDKKMGVTP